MTAIEFEAWPKTPRLRKAGATVITEKIDGTNACIVILPVGLGSLELGRVARVEHQDLLLRGWDGEYYLVGAQSRKKMIWPGKNTDNAGFAGWVWQNAQELVRLLGPGRHYGEWWGRGVQRGYAADRKFFSLFNAGRWNQAFEADHQLEVDMANLFMSTVPVLYTGPFSDKAIDDALNRLRREGSVAAAEWGMFGQKAEGIVVRHRELGGNLKVMLENDDIPKGEL